MKHLTLAATALTMMALAAVSQANAVAKSMTENAAGFSFSIVGAQLSQDENHALAEGRYWPTAITIEEDYGTVSSDTITISGSSHHHSAPHGEPPNQSIFNFKFTAKSAGWKKGSHKMFWSMGSFPHADHWNGFNMTFTGSVYSGTFWNGFSGYVLIVSGRHSDFQIFPISPMEAPATGYAVVPPVKTQRFGAARVELEQATGRANIHLATNIEPHWILGAELCVGPKGANGDVVMSLADMGSLNPVGELGSAMAAFEVPLPPHVYAAIDQGRAYIQVRTLQHPLGEIRADLRRNEPAPIFPGVTID
ncbi:MAG: CHRD domain-containing protein [Fimbriimonadaceae bacterium]|nr:CHRD domain-containing protein [Fimbriimonadaceae bacterium]QYK57440.1 MAG: CHRD domain-containing protein [Fimbriimonadaceae bacterium]